MYICMYVYICIYMYIFCVCVCVKRVCRPMYQTMKLSKLSLKVREGRRAADFPKLCVFLNITAISEDI